MPTLTQQLTTPLDVNTAYNDMVNEGVPPKLAAMIMNQYDINEVVAVSKIRFKDTYGDGSRKDFTASKMISSPNYLYAFSSNGRFKVVHSSYWGSRDNKYRVCFQPTKTEKDRYMSQYGYPDSKYYRTTESRFAKVFSGLYAHSTIYEIKISSNHHNPYREASKPDPAIAALESDPINVADIEREINKLYGDYIRSDIKEMIEYMYTRLRDIPWDRDNNARIVSWGTHGRASGKCYAVEHIEHLEKILSQEQIFDFSDKVRHGVRNSMRDIVREMGYLSNVQELTLAMKSIPNIRPKMVKWFLDDIRRHKQAVDNMVMEIFNAKLAGK